MIINPNSITIPDNIKNIGTQIMEIIFSTISIQNLYHLSKHADPKIISVSNKITTPGITLNKILTHNLQPNLESSNAIYSEGIPGGPTHNIPTSSVTDINIKIKKPLLIP